MEWVTVLDAAGLSDGEESGHGDLAIGTKAAEAGLAQLDGAAESGFGRVFGWFHAVIFDEDKELLAVDKHCPGKIAHVFVAAVEVSLGEGKKSFLDRNRLVDQLLTCDRAVPDSWPGTKTMSQEKHARVQRERIAAEPLGIRGFGEFLNAQDVSFEVAQHSG